MATNHEPTAKAEATPKGIRKVNLSDLSGELNQRGRERYNDPELAEAMRELLKDKQPFIWEAVVIEGDDKATRDACKAKWRNRAISVMEGVNDKAKLTVRWTKNDEMVVLLATKK